MGVSGSSCSPTNIANQKAQNFFADICALESSEALPVAVRTSKYNKALVRIIYDSLKRVPEHEQEFGVVVTGNGVGPMFVEYFITRLGFPVSLTKFSLRNSCLRSMHALQVAEFLASVRSLKEFEVSNNDLGAQADVIVKAAINHPNLRSIQIEDANVQNNATEPLLTLIKASRKLETLRISPLNLTKKGEKEIESALQKNIYIKNATISKSLDAKCEEICARNILIGEIVDSIARAPFQRQFRAKIDSFKSVKGRQMITKKSAQKEKLRGSALFDQIEQAERRAKVTEVQETLNRTSCFRSGHAEMVGRRQAMEDVSIALTDVPTQGAMLFGLFDGHGGREAAEYAAQHLPKSLTEKMKAGGRIEDAYVSAFKHTQADMAPWCSFVGTTAVLAVLDGTTLTVANVGDSRCVLCRDGKAMRISVDHKPDLPEEMEYIESKGGFVRDGRVKGMLAVSRALGDGFLSDIVNPVPHFRRLELTEDDSFLILACDGVWDVLTDQMACDLVASEIDPLVAAKKIRDTAFENKSLDNISVIVVFLSEAFPNDA